MNAKRYIARMPIGAISWSCCPSWEKRPEWLACERVLALGGGPPKEWRRRYRADCEAAIREGGGERPWEALIGRLLLITPGTVKGRIVGELALTGRCACARFRLRCLPAGTKRFEPKL